MATAEMLRLRGSLRAQIRSCRLCPLHASCKAPVPWRGALPEPGKEPDGTPIPGTTRLVVVGEAPGRAEDKAGQPFVGPSGSLVDEWLREYVFDSFNKMRMEDVAFVNAVSCFPNRTPGTSEILACRVNLHAQLSALNPEMLLLLGGVAVSSFWHKMRIGDVRGRWWSAPVMDDGKIIKYVPAMATWHPSAVLRGNGADDVISDLKHVRMCLFREAAGPYERPGCVMCGEENDANEHWLLCDLALGKESNVAGSPLTLPFCDKHWRLRMGKVDQKRRTRMTKKQKEEEERVRTTPGLFDG